MKRDAFSNALKSIRAKKNITQEELADIVGVSRDTVIKWESSQRTPTVDQILKVAESMHVDSEYLLGIQPANASQDFEQLLTGISQENPNFGGLLRSTVENVNDLNKEDFKFLSDSLSIAFGRISGDLRSRMEKESKDGRL
jgi:transcriptional regulator with XRE-family HTH domain